MVFLYLRRKQSMNKSILAIIIYVLGIIFGALLFNLWAAETSLIKACIGLVWTIFFLIALFYADKHEQK